MAQDAWKSTSTGWEARLLPSVTAATPGHERRAGMSHGGALCAPGGVRAPSEGAVGRAELSAPSGAAPP